MRIAIRGARGVLARATIPHLTGHALAGNPDREEIEVVTAPDRPLVGKPHPGKWHPRLYIAELVGMGLLVGGGVSVVIFMFGRGSPVPALLPSAGWRRLITGFLFGLVGALIGVSRIGKVSGAHINPAVTIAFLAEGKLALRDAFGYVMAQFGGALLAIPALAAWGAIGASVQFGATIPAASQPTALAVVGEAAVTFLMVTVIFVLAAHRRTQPFTPWSMPLLFAVMVWLEAPLSGTSANPARSLAPNLLAGQASVLWIYFVGPITGALAAVGLLRFEVMHRHHPAAARVAHFHVEREQH